MNGRSRRPVQPVVAGLTDRRCNGHGARQRYVRRAYRAPASSATLIASASAQSPDSTHPPSTRAVARRHSSACRRHSVTPAGTPAARCAPRSAFLTTFFSRQRLAVISVRDRGAEDRGQRGEDHPAVGPETFRLPGPCAGCRPGWRRAGPACSRRARVDVLAQPHLHGLVSGGERLDRQPAPGVVAQRDAPRRQGRASCRGVTSAAVVCMNASASAFCSPPCKNRWWQEEYGRRREAAPPRSCERCGGPVAHKTGLNVCKDCRVDNRSRPYRRDIDLKSHYGSCQADYDQLLARNTAGACCGTTAGHTMALAAGASPQDTLCLASGTLDARAGQERAASRHQERPRLLSAYFQLSPQAAPATIEPRPDR